MAVAVSLSGCLYIPTIEHDLLSGRAMISKRDIAAFAPGETRRADVLLKLGDPSIRLDEYRFFCYAWERMQGFIGTGYGGVGGSKDVGKQYYFCAQFSSANVYLRGRRIKASLSSSAEKRLYAILDEWRKTPESPDPESNE